MKVFEILRDEFKTAMMLSGEHLCRGVGGCVLVAKTLYISPQVAGCCLKSNLVT